MMMSAATPTLRVEVVFALPERQELLCVDVVPGATVQQAIDLSGIARRFPGHALDALPVGVWGVEVPRDRPLRDGDRVEIYRELAMDPREARRRLALQGKRMGAGPQ